MNQHVLIRERGVRDGHHDDLRGVHVSGLYGECGVPKIQAPQLKVLPKRDYPKLKKSSNSC